MSADPFARRIIHIDMDAFFAAVEMRENPHYCGKPLVVGGDPDQRGTVATCNYEARAFGIHSAMASKTARRLCPRVIFVRPRIDLYREISMQTRVIFRSYTDRIEPLSLDEAYLDVSDCSQFEGVASKIAADIKRQIVKKLELTASAGVSYNKFLAKIASDMNKPDGLTVVRPQQAEAFVAALPVSRFFGVGPVTEERMKKLGIHTGADLRRWSLGKLRPLFGKHAQYYYDAARGRDFREVVADRARKSLSSENTFLTDLDNFEQMLAALKIRAREVALGLQELSMTGRTMTIKVKFSDFTEITRSHSFDQPMTSYLQMVSLLPELLHEAMPVPRKVRLLGVAVSNLSQPLDQREFASDGSLPGQLHLL